MVDKELSRQRLHHLLDVAIKSEEAGTAILGDIIYDKSFSSTQRQWAVKEICRLASETKLQTSVEILRPRMYDSIPHELLGIMVTQTVERRFWSVVCSLLQRNVTYNKRRWAVEEAVQHADSEALEQILPHCTYDQLDPMLEVAVNRRLWAAVAKLIQREVSESKRAWAIDEVMKHAQDDHLELTLPHCTNAQLDLALDTAVKRRLWSVVDTLLQRDVSDAKRIWAVDEAIKHADTQHLESILSQCSDDQTETPLKAAAKRGLWGTVEKLLRRGLQDDQRRWAVEEAVKHASDEEMMTYIHEQYWDEDQRDLLLTTAVTRGMWGCVAELLKLRLSLEQTRTAVLEASKRATGDNLKNIILYHCAVLQSSGGWNFDDTLDSMCTNLIKRDEWEVLTTLMSNNESQIPQAQRSLIEENLLRFFQYYVCGDRLASVLPDLLSGNKWSILSTVFRDKQKSDFIEEAVKHAESFLIDCPKHLQDRFMTEAVQRGFWKTVARLLDFNNVSEEAKRMAVKEAIARAEDTDFVLVAETYTGGQQQCVLEEADRRGLWANKKIIANILQRGVDDKNRWALDKALQHAEGIALVPLLYYCSNEQLSSVAIDILRKHDQNLWWHITELMAERYEGTELKCFLQEVSKHATDTDLENFLSRISRLRPDLVLEAAVKRHLWLAAGSAIKGEVSNTNRVWAVKQALEHADTEDLPCILPYCAEDQLYFVLSEAVQRGSWMSVASLLNRISTKKEHQWVIDEASKRASDNELSAVIRHTDMDADQLDSVLMAAVARELWGSVLNLFKRNPTKKCHQWVIDEASKRANDQELTDIIDYTDMDEDQLESVLTTAVARELWKSVLKLLKLGIPDERRKWAILEACKFATDGDLNDIISHCCKKDKKMEDSVFTHLLDRHQWEVLRNVKKRLSDSQRAELIAAATKYADDPDIVQMLEVLPLCPDDLPDSTMKTAVKRGLWSTVGALLSKVSEKVKECAIEEALKHAENSEFRLIAKECSDHHVDLALTEAVRRRLWEDVLPLLARGAGNKKQLLWVIVEASQHAEETVLLELIKKDEVGISHEPQLWSVVFRLLDGKVKDSRRSDDGKWGLAHFKYHPHLLEKAKQEREADIQRILSRCPANLLDIAVTKAVRGRQWDCVGDLLTREVSATKRNWTLREASKHANQTQLRSLLLHCTDSVQIEAVVKELAKRNMWWCLEELLETLLATNKLQKEFRGWLLLDICQRGDEFSTRCIRSLRFGHSHRVLSKDSALYHALQETVRRGFFQATSVLQQYPLTILPHEKQPAQEAILEATSLWNKDRVEAAIKKTMKAGHWPIVICLLHHPNTGNEVRNRAVELGLRFNNIDYRTFYDLVHMCERSQLIPALEQAVAKNIPDSTVYLLKRIAEEGDLLSVTERGETLLKAVLRIKNGRQNVVSECIKLGMSTHQPTSGDFKRMPLINSLFGSAFGDEHLYFRSYTTDADMTIAKMLFESGACTHHTIHQFLDAFEQSGFSNQYDKGYREVHAFAQRLASHPRSLKSACRLVISHCLGVGCSRQEKVKQLPLPDPVKKYVLFSDLEPEDGNSDAIAVGDMLCQDLALQYSIASASDDLVSDDDENSLSDNNDSDIDEYFQCGIQQNYPAATEKYIDIGDDSD